VANGGEHFREEFSAVCGACGVGSVVPAGGVEIRRRRGWRVCRVVRVRGKDFGCGGTVEEDR